MKHAVLDHGYVDFVEAWGADSRIIEAARMSTGKGFLGWGPKEDGAPGDEKLLKFLYDNKHHTPFEMAGLIIEVQAPIFVFREWHRHRTQSYNELSARYAPLPELEYVPTIERLMINASAGNKQAGTISGAQSLTELAADAWRQRLVIHNKHTQALYDYGLSIGVPKELARIPVSVGRYSRMRAAANLRNWLAFLTLRTSEKAQWEIRQYANIVGKIISDCFPRTWELFVGDLVTSKLPPATGAAA